MKPTCSHAVSGCRISSSCRGLVLGIGLAVVIGAIGCGSSTSDSAARITPAKTDSTVNGLKPVELPHTTNSLGMEFVQIPAGEYQMGSPDSDGWSNPDEKPQHREVIKRPFWIGKHEVTVGQFRKFVNAAKFETAAELSRQGGYAYHKDTQRLEPDTSSSWRKTGFEQDETHPVVNVTWHDAQEFCAWLSREEKATYRLPTEVEWEYACRAGTTTPWYCGSDEASVRGQANICDSSLGEAYPFASKWTMTWNDGYAFTAPVGTFPANRFGLHDMLGNVFEWCVNEWDGKDYAGKPVPDEFTPDITETRVLRGGSYLSLMTFNRSADRVGLKSRLQNAITGFRVVRDVASDATPGEEKTHE